MNRRARSSHRSSSQNRSLPFLKFLKPGALAQIRDSRRISTVRSNRIALISQIRPTSPSSSSVSALPHITVSSAAADASWFSGRIYGPRFLQRKKLVAGKSVMFLRAPLSPVNDSPDPIIDLFGSDIAAH